MSNELSNFDIIDIIKQLQLDYCFGGVYSKDQLPPEQELISTSRRCRRSNQRIYI